MLRGENTQKIYRLGDKVQVQVIRVDMERRQIDLGLVGDPRARARVGEQPRPAAQQGASRRRSSASGTREQAGRKRKQRPGKNANAQRAQTLNAISVVVGTAGHIDHGKSALVLALTGTDPDRLKEEKARGITIDLGFAHADDRRRRRRVRRRAGPRAVREEHAGRRRRDRRGAAGRRRRRIGDAADARALRDLPAAAGAAPA